MEILIAVVAFTSVVLVIVGGLIAAEKRLVAQGEVSIEINGDAGSAIAVSPGTNLLDGDGQTQDLSPSACGGGGSCAMCKCQIFEGAVICSRRRRVISTAKKPKRTGGLRARSRSKKT